MSPATSWTELTVSATSHTELTASATAGTELTVDAAGWQHGIPVRAGNPDDYYIDVLFEGTVFFNPHIPWTELT